VPRPDISIDQDPDICKSNVEMKSWEWSTS